MLGTQNAQTRITATVNPTNKTSLYQNEQVNQSKKETYSKNGISLFLHQNNFVKNGKTPNRT